MEIWSKLANAILNAYLNDDFLLIIVYGTPRIGKSVYAAKVMWQVYNDYLAWYPDTTQGKIDVLENFMGWKPENVVDRWLNLEKRIPAYTWDDGGCWLFSLDWNDPVLKEIQRYMNVIGTDMNCLMITTPSPGWILKKLGFMPGARWVKIIKRLGDPYGDIKVHKPSVRFARQARIYKPYQNPDLKAHRVKREKFDNFSCKMNDDVYAYYKPIRMKYAAMVKDLMRKKMLENIKKASKKKKDKESESEVENTLNDIIQIEI